jgi:hypothetical protein
VGERVESLQAPGLDRHHAVLLLQHALHEEDGRGDQRQAAALEELGVTITLAMPVSSFKLGKTKPLAVPGRWRTNVEIWRLSS